MQKYIGTKTILARPMSRQEYNDYRGWELPADENGADEGMLVEYVDGGKANDSRHAGYISWSPKGVFERAYHPLEDRQPHQQRVVEEKAELDERLEKLCLFSNSRTFAELPIAEQERLNTQRHLMCALSAVLGARIAAFEQRA